MGDHLTIETPEQISLDLPLAGIGSRFLAVGLDTLLQIGSGLVILVVWLALSALAGGGRTFSQGSVWPTVLIVMGVFLLQYGYFAFFEAIWHGQTPGKRYTHLRVVKISGQAIGTYESVARNLVRIVDSFPGFYVIGILSALLSSQSRRLGDYVAGTVVIRELPVERPLETPGQPRAAGASPGGRPGAPAGAYAASLSDEEFQLIDAFLMRRAQLTGEVRRKLAGQIVGRIASRLGIPADDRRNEEGLLEKLADAYRATVQFRS